MTQNPARTTRNTAADTIVDMGDCTFSTRAPNSLLTSVQLLWLIPRIRHKGREVLYSQKRWPTFLMDPIPCTPFTTNCRQNLMPCWFSIVWSTYVIWWSWCVTPHSSYLEYLDAHYTLTEWSTLRGYCGISCTVLYITPTGTRVWWRCQNSILAIPTYVSIMVLWPRDEPIFCSARNVVAKLGPKIRDYDSPGAEPTWSCIHSGICDTRRVTEISKPHRGLLASLVGCFHLHIPWRSRATHWRLFWYNQLFFGSYNHNHSPAFFVSESLRSIAFPPHHIHHPAF